MFAIQVKNKDNGEWETKAEGDAKSRRKFLQAHGQSKRTKNEYGYRFWSQVTGLVGELVSGKKQWRCVQL